MLGSAKQCSIVVMEIHLESNLCHDTCELQQHIDHIVDVTSAFLSSPEERLVGHDERTLNSAATSSCIPATVPHRNSSGLDARRADRVRRSVSEHSTTATAATASSTATAPACTDQEASSRKSDSAWTFGGGPSKTDALRSKRGMPVGMPNAPERTWGL